MFRGKSKIANRNYELDLLDSRAAADSENSTRTSLLHSSSHDALPERYKQLKIELYHNPHYAATSTGPLPPYFDHGDVQGAHGRHFRGVDENFNWKPSYSGQNYRNVLKWVCWLLPIAHLLISLFAKLTKNSFLRTSIPAGLATILVVSTMTVTAAEVRREGYVLFSTAKDKIMHRKMLRRTRWLVVYLLAPLISVNLSAMSYDTVSSVFIWFGSHTKLYTFESWNGVIDRFAHQVPCVNRPSNTSLQADTDSSGWETWKLADAIGTKLPGWRAVPNALRLAQADYTWSDPTNDLPGWNELIKGEAAIMPVFLGRTPGKIIASSTAKVDLRLLSSSLHCTLLGQANTWHLNTTTTILYKNCQGSIFLRNQTLHADDREELEAAYHQAISAVQALLNENPDNTTEPQLKRHMQSLVKEKDTLKTYSQARGISPTLVTTKSTAINGRNRCDGSYFFFSDLRPIRNVAETSIPPEDTVLAYCESNFQGRDLETRIFGDQSAYFEMGQQQTEPIQFISRGGLDIQLAPSRESSFLKFIDLFTTNVRRVADEYWRDVADDITIPLSIHLASNFPQHLDLKKRWFEDLLQYRLKDAMVGSNISTLALMSRYFSLWAAETISESADLSLANMVSSSLTYKIQPEGLTKITVDLIKCHAFVLGDFASWWWFRTSVVLILIICTISLFTADDHACDAPTGLPWSISSIAARALLICNSRIISRFNSPFDKPDMLFSVNDLTFGYWTNQNGKAITSWHLDSKRVNIGANPRPNESNVLQSSDLSHRHNMSTIPAVVHPWIDITKSIVILAVIAVMISLMQHLNTKQFSHHYLPIILFSEGATEPGWPRALVFFLLPQMLVFAFIGWWNDLDLFYCTRQPWAGLASPRPARFNLTLDYLDCRSRLWNAYRNRHVQVFSLGIGSVAILILPLVCANIFRVDESLITKHKFLAMQNYTWDIDDQDFAQRSMPNTVPGSAFNSLIKPIATSDWITSVTNATEVEAILPVLLNTSEYASPLPLNNFQRVRTKSLRGALECVHPNFVIEYSTIEGSIGVRPDRVKVTLPDPLSFADGNQTAVLKTCEQPFFYKNPVENLHQSQPFFCSQWHLLPISVPSLTKPAPVWLIPMVLGQLHSWNPKWGLLLQPGFQTRVLACKSSALIANGTVDIFSSDNDSTLKSRNRIIRHLYKRHEDEEIPDAISEAFDNMLNASTRDNRPEYYNKMMLNIPEPIIDPHSFVGDFLGYLLHRKLTTQAFSLDRLEDPVSSVYSTLFAHTVAHSEWLRRNTVHETEVNHMQWQQAFVMRKWALFLFIGVVSYLASIAAPLALKVQQKYVFPLVPEKLENSLFLLYQSTILDILKQIQHPEKLSMKSIHNRIEVLGHKYMFGRYEASDKHHEQYGIDREEEFAGYQIISDNEDEPISQQTQQFERYRDNDSESQNGNESESDSDHRHSHHSQSSGQSRQPRSSDDAASDATKKDNDDHSQTSHQSKHLETNQDSEPLDRNSDAQPPEQHPSDGSSRPDNIKSRSTNGGQPRALGGARKVWIRSGLALKSQGQRYKELLQSLMALPNTRLFAAPQADKSKSMDHPMDDLLSSDFPTVRHLPEPGERSNNERNSQSRTKPAKVDTRSDQEEHAQVATNDVQPLSSTLRTTEAKNVFAPALSRTRVPSVPPQMFDIQSETVEESLMSGALQDSETIAEASNVSSNSSATSNQSSQSRKTIQVGSSDYGIVDQVPEKETVDKSSAFALNVLGEASTSVVATRQYQLLESEIPHLGLLSEADEQAFESQRLLQVEAKGDGDAVNHEHRLLGNKPGDEDVDVEYRNDGQSQPETQIWTEEDTNITQTQDRGAQNTVLGGDGCESIELVEMVSSTSRRAIHVQNPSYSELEAVHDEDRQGIKKLEDQCLDIEQSKPRNDSCDLSEVENDDNEEETKSSRVKVDEVVSMAEREDAQVGNERSNSQI